MKGWLLDTHVVAALINPRGAPSVKTWAERQPEASLYLSILTLGEYDKGIFNLAEDHPDRPRYAAAREALALRFGPRVLPISNDVVSRWGRISGDVRRRTGHAPPVIDTFLAATAIDHGLYLVTRNVRDVQHTGATVFNPWVDDVTRFSLGSNPNPR